MERDTPAVENGPIEGASNVKETQQPLPEVNDSSHLEDNHLIVRAKVVGVDYEFAKPGEDESEDDRRKRQRRNRRISEQEKRLHDVVADIPPLPPAGSSHQEDNAYSANRVFEVE